MTGLFPAPLHLAWTLAPFAAAAALLRWRSRRSVVERRIAKGLRYYTQGAQVLS